MKRQNKPAKARKQYKEQELTKIIKKYEDLYKKWGIEPNGNPPSLAPESYSDDSKEPEYWTIISTDTTFKEYPKDWPNHKKY